MAIAALSLFAVVACGRDQDRSETGRTPIVETRLRTPKGTTRVGQALSAHTPKADEEDEPIVHEAKPVATKAKPPAEPTLAPSPTAADKAAPAPSPEATQVRVARRGVVFRGVELSDAPSGQVLGEFQGRTDVEVLEEREGWARVRTKVVDGGAIEGWIETARLADPAKPVATKPAKPGLATAQAGPTKTDAKADGGKAATAPKPAPAKTAKKAGDKGPDKVNLVPIAGTEKKRPATPFTHKAHYDDYSIKCESCHHPVKAKGGEVGSYVCSTSGCHTANECNGQTVGKKNKACPNFEDAYHLNCIECHKRDGGPTKCAECHTG